MGILLRGPKENFDSQIHTEANSLTSKMKKDFAVRKKTLDLFTKYSKFTSFMYATNRVNGGIRAKKVMANRQISDNAYRIQYDGSMLMPAYFFGAVQVGGLFEPSNPNPDMTAVSGVEYTNSVTSGTVETDTPISIALKHEPDNNIFGDKFNPNDSIALDAGHGIFVVLTGTPRKSSTGDHYVVDGKTVGDKALFDADHFAEDKVATEGGNFFGEGSLRGYQRNSRNKWRINYSSIHRYSLIMTGSAKSQKITNVINDETDASMWEFSEVLRAEEMFHLQNELALRYSRNSMDVTSHKWFENYGANKLSLSGFKAESGLAAPILGDGWIPQIQDNAEFTYNPNDADLTYILIEDIMNVLAQRSPAGTTGNDFIFVVDRVGRMVIDRALKKLIGYGNAAVSTATTATNVVSDIMRGKENKIGFTINKYEYLGNSMIVIEDELLNNPGLFDMNGGMVGTGNIYILNGSKVDGVSNFEIIARSGRNMLKKYINGMHSFQRGNDSSVASSGFDGARVDLLTEILPVLYDAQSCGILKATAAYNGGSLQGTDFLQNNDTAKSFMF